MSIEQLAREADMIAAESHNGIVVWRATGADLERFAAIVRAAALADAAKWCHHVQCCHQQRAETLTDVEEAEFRAAEACGAEDCCEAIRAEGVWP